MSEMQIGNHVPQNTPARQPALVDATALRMATRDAFLKLSPRHLVKSPVMAIVLLGTVLSALITLAGQAAPGFGWTVTAILLLTVLFGNFAEAIAEGRGKETGDAQRAARAGLLSKCDLATEMVGEFPEMQGVAGYYYALNDDEPQDVALALNEQYMPRGAGAELPGTLTGAAVAIADKLDTLVGIFGIGMLPTGSKDPYALRRAALGILRILIDKKLDLDLTEAVNFAVTAFGAKIKSAGLADQVLEFIFDRLRARYEDEGVDVATYLSVRALQPTSALDFDQRVQAVQAFRQLPEAAALAAVNKRVSNLLSKVDGKVSTHVEAKFFDNASEFSLYSAIQKADEAVQPMAAARQYNEALTRLAALREPVDAFFEAVMINAEDANVRANRYALLARLRGLFLGVADISLLG